MNKQLLLITLLSMICKMPLRGMESAEISLTEHRKGGALKPVHKKYAVEEQARIAMVRAVVEEASAQRWVKLRITDEKCLALYNSSADEIIQEALKSNSCAIQ